MNQTKIKNIAFMKIDEMKKKTHNHIKNTINKKINYFFDIKTDTLFVDYEKPKELVAYINKQNQISIYRKIER